ncbi:enoyl-CoA hydratase/isomerase family protein [Salmonella enterica]|nr:enoyl-CoA hydratase/isomerase family protein [Salmonella enterica]EDR0632157.1 enoyl-CoA hydratase/isomerase family protein [Salmonella enterica subsp. enterica serovar Javiana]EFE9024931.1 enoyl-CoA hydratase/isomerase family protein [Escherichia coli]EBG2188899.1 enoyl-CoA hydratase/isomerase family protein [Salmonella enterica]ECK4090677.1 enoyl-CoA hydratase/isomerase family protein [Salmonella enterica]
MSEKWSKEFDSCFQVGSIEEIADALEKRSGSEENALAMLASRTWPPMAKAFGWS